MIETSTFDFLSELAVHNERNWFNTHKEDFIRARENVLHFTTGLLRELVKIDPALPAEMTAQNCLLRIYRDVRFSKDKTPYKSNFGISITPFGKNFNGPGYYIHIEPEKSFIAGGSWMPSADQLKAIRQEIDYGPLEFHHIVDDASFRAYFGALSTEDTLKTSPKGYSPDHPDIEFLRLKSFVAVRDLDDKILKKSDAIKTVADIVEKLYPLMVFLRNYIA